MDENYEHETHMLWTVTEDLSVHVISEIGYPIFSLEDISAIFGYDFGEVAWMFRHHARPDEYTVNQTFVSHPEGVYVSILIPLLLAKVAVMDRKIDEAQAWDRIGIIGRVVEEMMEDGDKYMEVMTKKALELLGEAFE